MTTATFTMTRRVAFCETDMAGIVHFANFARYMEEAEHEFFRSLGLSIMQSVPAESGAGEAIIGWPRVSHSCNYKAPAYFEDILTIELSVSRKGVKSLTLDFTFTRDETLIAKGTMKTVCCYFEHGEPMRSIEIPPEVSDKIGEVDAG